MLQPPPRFHNQRVEQARPRRTYDISATLLLPSYLLLYYSPRSYICPAHVAGSLSQAANAQSRQSSTALSRSVDLFAAAPSSAYPEGAFTIVPDQELCSSL